MSTAEHIVMAGAEKKEVAHLAADLRTDHHEGESPRLGGGRASRCDGTNHRCCDDDYDLLHSQSGRSSCWTRTPFRPWRFAPLPYGPCNEEAEDEIMHAAAWHKHCDYLHFCCHMSCVLQITPWTAASPQQNEVQHLYCCMKGHISIESLACCHT